MVCKNCGKENGEDAVYCRACGVRLDGKILCPHCGKAAEGDSLFCPACGNRLNAATEAAKGRAQACPPKKRNREGVLKNVSCAISVALLLVTLVFSFCVGITATASVSGAEASETSYLYEYFGKVYSTAKTNCEISSGVDWFAVYFPYIIGTIVAAVTLLSAVLCGALGVRAFYRKWVQKKEADVKRIALFAFLIYLGCAVALRGLNAYYYMVQQTVEITVGYNGATVAGFVLGFVLLAADLACSLLIARKQPFDAKAAGQAGVSAAEMILSLVCAFLTAGCAASLSFSGEKISAGFALAMQNAEVRGVASRLMVAYCTVGMMVGIASLAVWLAVFGRRYRTALAPDFSARKGLGLPVLGAALSVASLVFAVLTGRLFAYSLFEGSVGASFAVPIAALVLSLVLLALVVTAFVWVRRAAQHREGEAQTAFPVAAEAAAADGAEDDPCANGGQPCAQEKEAPQNQEQ